MQPGCQLRVIAGLVLQDAQVFLGREHQRVDMAAIHGAGHLPAEGLGVVDVGASGVCRLGHGNSVLIEGKRGLAFPQHLLPVAGLSCARIMAEQGSAPCA